MDLRCDNRANIYIKHTTPEMLSANRNVKLNVMQENGHNLKNYAWSKSIPCPLANTDMTYRG